MNKTIDERVKEIMALKEKVGEFSLDLYFDDCDSEGVPYIVKVHSAADDGMLFYGKGAGFEAALDKAEEYIKNYKA